MRKAAIGILAFVLALVITPIIKLLTWREQMLQDIRHAEDRQKRIAAEDEARGQSAPRH